MKGKGRVKAMPVEIVRPENRSARAAEARRFFPGLSRRTFLRWAVGLVGALATPGLCRAAGTPYPHFFFTQIKYRGGEWDPNPAYAGPIVEELELRTSIDAARERRLIEVSDPAMFYSPFVYMAGRYDFDPFTEGERAVLKRFFRHGGFMLAEDTTGAEGFGFDRAFRREMGQVFPNQPLTRLAPDHSVYQSFYLMNSVAGRLRTTHYLEGITVGNWTPVIYSRNDLSGAWSKNPFGKWIHACVPGGEDQRKTAFKVGINLIVYSLTTDYKRDLVHHPFIRRRLNL